MKQEGKFGFLSLLSMIVGICIGSGIFFKASNILEATGGNVWLGTVIFGLGAISIIFGGLAFAQLASLTKKDGGVIGYFEEFLGAKIGAAFAWFQAFLYLPSLVAIISWVVGIYSRELFGITVPAGWELLAEIGIGLLFFLFFLWLNHAQEQAGAKVQSLTTFIKLIPLFCIAIAGLIWGKGNGIESLTSFSFSQQGWSWISAIVPMAFAYDGWIVATTLGNKIKNSKRNLPLALTIAPLIILVVYLLYFWGIIQLLGVEKVLAEGKNAVYAAGNLLLGTAGGKVILTCVLISLIGVLNGLVIGLLRLPQLLLEKRMLGKFNFLLENTQNSKYENEQKSAFSALVLKIALISTLMWISVHFVVMKRDLFNGGDISEIAIVFSYVAYGLLYLRMFSLKAIPQLSKRWLIPALALLGSVIIVAGSLLLNPLSVGLFLLFCGSFCLFAYAMQGKQDPNG